MKNKSEVVGLIKKLIRYDEFNEDDDSVYIVIDRYRRHDHGGGDDGDDWLDDYEIDKDFNCGKEKHSTKLDKVNLILKESGYKPNAEFELGEKGHFSINFELDPS